MVMPAPGNASKVPSLQGGSVDEIRDDRLWRPRWV